MMGRAAMPDCGKSVTTYGGNMNKRALFGSGASGPVGAPTFSDVATLCTSGYNSRPGSSQHNGEILGGFPIRSTYPSNVDPNVDGVSSFFNAIGYNGQSAPPRNFSEPSLFPSIPINRTVGTDLSGRLTAGGSVKPLNDPVSMRNTGNLFSSGLGGDTSTSNSSTLNSSSKGVKLDPSEFPPILTSVGRSGNTSLTGNFHSSSSHPPLRNYVSVMSKGSLGAETSSTQLEQQFNPTVVNQTTPPEFSKQDFPALPGHHSSVPNTSTSASPGTLTPFSTPSRPLGLNPAASNSTVVGSSLNAHRSLVQSGSLLNSSSGFPSTSASSSTHSTGIQLLSNHFVENIPQNMICDQFGMLGLLKLIRVGDYDATLNMLAPGLDLASLHSNWQNPGELHNTFVSPCHESCIGRPQDMDYAVPPEYLIRHLITDRLPDPPMDQLSEETLFWLFYNCCREEAQLVVAKELYQREWRFHKKEQIWLTRIMGANFTTDSNSEQGDYYFWDPLKAQKSSHQMTILYSDLDDAPSAFKLSSGTLSAFVSLGLSMMSGQQQQQSHSHSALHQQQQQQHQQQQQQQQQMAAYQQQQQYSQQHSLLNRQHQPSSGQMLGQQQPGGPGAQSATTLACLINARQQQKQQQQHQPQLPSPTANFFQPPSIHSRTGAIAPLLFNNRLTNNATTGSSPQTPSSATSGSASGTIHNTTATASSIGTVGGATTIGAMNGGSIGGKEDLCLDNDNRQVVSAVDTGPLQSGFDGPQL